MKLQGYLKTISLTTAFLLAVTGASSAASLVLAPTTPQLTLLDPVPGLLSGAAVTTNDNILATKGRKVQGAGADGATEMVLRIPTRSAGDQFTITVENDQHQQSSSAAEDGALGAIGSTSFTLSQLTVAAVATSKGPMAFAIYLAPVDFPRPEGQDAGATERFIYLQVTALASGSSSTTTVTLLRPPLVLVHGLWSDPTTWNNFTPLIGDARFFIQEANYSTAIGSEITQYSPGLPFWSSPDSATTSALGFSYNAPTVLGQIQNFVGEFKNSMNPAKIPVAGVQADIVAHSMGGDITRTLPLLTAYLSNNTLALGPIHKVVTIATPHWGSPLAGLMLDGNDGCVRGVLADAGSVAFSSVTLNGKTTADGGVFDLEGDGFGGGLSAAITAFQQPIPHPLPTALIDGLESQSQLDGLDSSATALFIRLLCSGDTLANDLTSTGWPTIFNQDSDSIVPQLSELDGLTGTEVTGVIHSASSEQLGFGPPAELDASSGVASVVINLLNTPVTSSTYIPLPQ
ncbi:MAG TPA: hypothetical protein VGW33_03965 [Terriglobia bacterium]|nr:hypothetical protein [Terriglobia bacterium]